MQAIPKGIEMLLAFFSPLKVLNYSKPARHLFRKPANHRASIRLSKKAAGLSRSHTHKDCMRHMQVAWTRISRKQQNTKRLKVCQVDNG